MSNEIKEILDYLKNNTFIPDETKRKYKILHRDEVKKLLDYITNLQQRIEYLERSNNRREENITSLQDECTELEQENERLKENNQAMQEEMARVWEENEYLKKHQRFHKKFGNDYIFCVEGDKETYKDLLLEKQEELEDYKSRVEKAKKELKDWEKLDLDNLLVAIRKTQKTLQGGKDDNKKEGK